MFFCACLQDDDLELTYFLLSPDDKVLFLCCRKLLIFSNLDVNLYVKKK